MIWKNNKWVNQGLLVSGLLLNTSAMATGIPVLDAANMTQTTVSAFENSAQTLKQIEQYKAQIEEWEGTFNHYETQVNDMIKNTFAPGVFLWDEANQLVDGVLNLTDTIDYYVNGSGSLMDYLDKYQDVRWYRSSDCYQAGGCEEEYDDLVAEGSAAQKNANDALLRGIEQQQKQLKEDAEQLEETKALLEGAQGRMEALQYANMLSAQQLDYLLQLRMLLLQMQSAEAIRFQAEAAERSMRKAETERVLTGEYVASPGTGYIIEIAD